MNQENNCIQIGSHKFPKSILEKFKNSALETQSLITTVEKNYQKFLPGPFQIKIANSAASPLLADTEEAAFHAFLAKFRSIPNFPGPVITQRENNFFLGNEDLAKHIITEFRPIIFNEKDPIYFGKIYNTIYKMLNRKSPVSGTKMTAFNERFEDITDLLKKELAVARKVIVSTVELLELDYLYNGVLQHSDPRFSKRYRQDFRSGNLQYLFLKHAQVLTYLKGYLKYLEEGASLFWLPGHPKSGAL